MEIRVYNKMHERMVKHFGHEKYLCLIKMYLQQPPEVCRNIYSDKTLTTFVKMCKLLKLCGDVDPTFERVYKLVHILAKDKNPTLIQPIVDAFLRQISVEERSLYTPAHLDAFVQHPMGCWMVRD